MSAVLSAALGTKWDKMGLSARNFTCKNACLSCTSVKLQEFLHFLSQVRSLSGSCFERRLDYSGRRSSFLMTAVMTAVSLPFFHLPQEAEF